MPSSQTRTALGVRSTDETGGRRRLSGPIASWRRRAPSRDRGSQAPHPISAPATGSSRRKQSGRSAPPSIRRSHDRPRKAQSPSLSNSQGGDKIGSLLGVG